LETQWEEPGGRSEAFDACVEDIRKRLDSDNGVLTRLEDLIRRRLGVAPRTAATAALAGLIGVGTRLVLALFATALVGQWAGIPWGRWAVILAFFGLLDGTTTFLTPPLDVPSGPRVRRIMEDWTALLPTIVRESDLQDLAAFTRRWSRWPVGVVLGVGVATITLLACLLFAPTATSDLPAGSTVLLALLLYEFGAVPVYWGNFIWAFIVREAGYDHHLFWPSPVDSPEVQKAMRMMSAQGAGSGLWVTMFLLAAVVLVSWDSPVVLPLAVGFILIGYLTTIGSAVIIRTSLRKIVQRVRDGRLAVLQHRIDAFGPRFADLSPRETERLRGLIDLHNMIRDAPTSPTTTHTLLHAAAGLIIPTIMFVVTVFGEVYAERVLDFLLP
jgi:hypothetical protein